ncbi:carbonic anhydrase [Chytriomyces cf. hyalinus JEL632]|nr:carbonic anhydrase [Chytriomyces cf. hyalinus JEL632]
MLTRFTRAAPPSLRALPRVFSVAARFQSTQKKPTPEVIKSLMRDSDPDLKDIIEASGHWANNVRERDPTFFDRIGKGQSPHYLYIGCCDARVDPTVLMNVEYGDLFIHRNVGNLVCGSDLNALSAIEFAVSRLKVPHIIVCGHYDCGAVRGSSKQMDHGIIENWLRNIRDVQRLNHKELSTVVGEEPRHRRLVELNVVEQCINVLKTGVVQQARMKSYLETGFAVPRVHALVFDPAAGELKKLDVKWADEMKEFDSIYNLYPKESMQ